MRRKVLNHGRTVTIQVECPGCHENIDYSIKLPTAVLCDKCGMISEARLDLLRKHRHNETSKKDKTRNSKAN